ncbi:MAG: hypothetical protein H7068_13415, partial [Pedobacter sp.]|nr:hypothetical protein [Chitinophagaceae bacterium]
NTTIVEQDYGKAFPTDLQKTQNGSASTFGSTDVNTDPTSSQTVFGGSDPGFGDGGDAGTPPDTPIDGGINLLIVMGIGKGLKSFKNRGDKSKTSGLKTSTD